LQASQHPIPKAATNAKRMANAKPFLTKAFLIIYPPFSKRWFKVSKMPTFNNSGLKISRKIMASCIFFFQTPGEES
jgi:hypothetical protein